MGIHPSGRMSPRTFFMRYYANYVAIAAAGVVFIVLQHKAALMHFWFDELISLCYARETSLWAALKQGVTNDGSGILFNSVLFLWYKIVPYGERWLLILPELCAALTVYAVGCTAKRFFGDISSLFAVAVTATSTLLLRYGNELRPYSMAALLSCLFISSFLSSRLDSSQKSGRVLPLGLCQAALVYCSPFTSTLCLCALAIDLHLVLQRKIRVRCLSSYALAACLYAPYALLLLTPGGVRPGAGYRMMPGDIVAFIRVTLDYNIVFLYLLVYALVAQIVRLLRARKSKASLSSEDNIALACTFFSVAPVIILYGLNRLSSLFLGVGMDLATRYFVFLIPPMALLITYAFFVTTETLRVTLTQRAAALGKSIFFASVLVYAICYAAYGLAYAPKHYSEDIKIVEAAAYLQERAASAEDAALYFCVPQSGGNTAIYRAARDGWVEYYLRRPLDAASAYRLADSVPAAEGSDLILTLENKTTLSGEETEWLENGYQLEENIDDLHIKIWRKRETT